MSSKRNINCVLYIFLDRQKTEERKSSTDDPNKSLMDKKRKQFAQGSKVSFVSYKFLVVVKY